jgi:4-hydroxybenzoyl-CoA thioesterase
VSAILEVRVAWGDCDEQGIVFYPRYFYWMDCAFQNLLRERGLNLKIIRGKLGALGMPTVDVGARFLASAESEDLLHIHARVEKWGEKSLRVAYEARRNGDAVFEGHEVRVWVVRDAGGGAVPARIPDEIRQALTTE